MGASFSRALAEGLRYEMSDAEFKETIQENIKRINTACPNIRLTWCPAYMKRGKRLQSLLKHVTIQTIRVV